MTKKKDGTKNKKRVNVTLGEETLKKAKEIGMGNVSMGLRLAVRDFEMKSSK